MRKSIFWLALGGLAATLIATPTEKTARTRLADGFDFPVGKPDAEGYYKARGFRPNGHLGEDWNGTGGGNTDLGDPIYSIANGMVVFARDVRKGWGPVVIVRHAFVEDGKLRTVDSLYGHLLQIMVKEGDQIVKGQQLGTMGNNRGMYAAHLHFEIRKNIHIGMNRSLFKRDFSNYYDPTGFIKPRRELAGKGRSALIAINTFDHTSDYGEVDPSTPTRTTADSRLPAAENEKRRSNFLIERFGDSFRSF